jgi:ribosomal protein S18 acetylase RimI-like enzyme
MFGWAGKKKSPRAEEETKERNKNERHNNKMNINYVSDYFADISLRDSFEIYAKKRFGLDLKSVRERGITNEKYIAFSAFDDDKCIASLCVYLENIYINGNKYNGGHLLTVGTLPEYEGNGIQKSIWSNYFEYAKVNNIDQTYLSTNYKAVGFYERFGFVRQYEHIHITEIQQGDIQTLGNLRKLNVEQQEDWKLIRRLSESREPVSDRIYLHNPNLFMFMCCFPHKDDLFYIEDLDCILVMKEFKDRILIYDMVSKEIPEQAILLGYLPYLEKKFIEYRFMTDKLNIPNIGKKFIDNSPLMVGRNFPKIDNDIVFSFTIDA